jgi:uncharacterized protein (TIRG00374 family)
MRLEKKYLTYTILVVVLGCLIYVLIALFSDFDKIKGAFLDYHYEYFLLGFLCIAVNWVNESLMLKTVTGGIRRVPFLRCFKIAMVTQFFNLITPFFTGGQPFTVYYFSKEGIEYEESIAAILYKSFTFQVAISLLGSVALFLSWNRLSVYTASVALVAIGINASIALLMFFLGKHQRTVDWIVGVVLKLLRKLRLMKHDEKVKANVDNRAREFVKMFEEFGSQRGLFLKLTGLNVINYSLYVASAVVILLGTGIGVDLQMVNRTVLLNVSSSVIPTPGTSGGVEGFYFLFLKSFVDVNVLMFSVFLWRMVSYYLNILVSGIFVGFGFLRNR